MPSIIAEIHQYVELFLSQLHIRNYRFVGLHGFSYHFALLSELPKTSANLQLRMKERQDFCQLYGFLTAFYEADLHPNCRCFSSPCLSLRQSWYIHECKI